MSVSNDEMPEDPLKIDGGIPWSMGYGFFEKVRAAVILFWPVICLFFLSMLWFGYSIIFYPSNYGPSGSIAVCSALLVDLWLRSCKWKTQAQMFLGHFAVQSGPHGLHNIYMSFDHAGRTGKTMRCTGIEIKNDKILYLQKLALQKEYSSESGAWSIASTASRVEKMLVFSAAILAVVGTYVWGYGPSCSVCQ